MVMYKRQKDILLNGVLIKNKIFNFRNNKIAFVLWMKGLATIILYWEFSGGDISLTIQVCSCVSALVFVKLKHYQKGKKCNWTETIETELWSLTLILTPLLLSIFDNWHGTFIELLKLNSIRYFMIDAILTIIIGRLMWNLRS